MKWIHLKHEYYACVDDEDYDLVSGYLWRHLHRNGYARCDELEDMTLHELLLGRAPDEQEIDHINRAPWDNRRSNLRIVPRWENQKNKGLPLNPPLPTPEEMAAAKEQRHNLKYGERHQKRRSKPRKGFHKHQTNDHVKRRVADDLGNEFESIVAAARHYGVKSPNCISLVCKGKLSQTHGRKWRYL